MRAKLVGGPFDQLRREVEESPPDFVLCTDEANPTLEHLYRLRGVERAGGGELAVYEHAAGAVPAGP